MTFSGEVTKANLGKTYTIAAWPTIVALIFYVFASSICAGLLRQLFSFTIVIEIFAFAIVIGALLVVMSLVVVEPKVRRLILHRPWLLGKVHGTFSSAFTTIWHQDMGIQLVSHDLVRHVNKRGYVVRANRTPFAIVPSICFFESDWHQVLDTLELQQPGFLHLNPPPNGSHICTLSIDRLSFLDMRLRGFRWKWTEGGQSWFGAFIATSVLWTLVSNTFLAWLYFPTILCVVFVFYILRISLWTWHTKRQFATERRGYLSVGKDDFKRSVSWFTADTVFWCDGLMWIQMPARFVQRVRVEFSVIEFCARGMEFRFHREGFQNHAAWLAASQSAKNIQGCISLRDEAR